MKATRQDPLQALNKSLSTVSILAGLVASWMTAESITHSSWPALVLIFIHPRLPALKAYIKELDTRAYPATREARFVMLRDVAWFCKMCSLRFGNACRRQAMVGVSCAFSHSAVSATPIPPHPICTGVAAYPGRLAVFRHCRWSEGRPPRSKMPPSLWDQILTQGQ